MPLVFNMSWIVCAYPTAKLLKIFESEGRTTEEIQEFHRK